MRFKSGFVTVALAAAIILAALVVAAYLAKAGAQAVGRHPDIHSPAHWYDLSCCSSIDCAPVEDGTVSEKEDGVHVEGHGILSYSDPRLRWSRDLQDHLCISQGSKKLLCVYRKPKGF